jgi:hypothetical protein
MSLIFYGVIIIGVVLSGLVLVVLYSLLVMARKGEESFEKLEIERLQFQDYPSSLPIRGQTKSFDVPSTIDLYHRGAN